MLTQRPTANGLPAESYRLLKVAEIADELRVGKMTIYRWINSGELKAVKFDRIVRVREKDFREFIEAHQSGSPASSPEPP